MIDLFSAIFGGSNQEQTSRAFQNAQSTQQSTADSQNTSQQQSTSQSTAQNFNPFTPLLGGNLTGLAQSLSGGLPTYSGQLFSPIGGNESDLLSKLMGMSNTGVAGTQDYLQKVLAGNFLPGQAGSNPFLEAAITAAQRPTLQGLEDTLSRALPGYFTANGHMIAPNNQGQGGSSAFDTAAALATRGASQAIADIATKMSSDAYGAERTAQQQAVPMSLGLTNQEVQSTVQNLQAQALPRMIQELGIERGLTLFQDNLKSLLQLLQTLGGITAPALGNVSASQSTGQSQGTSTAQSSGQSTSQGQSFSQGSGESTPGIISSITSGYKNLFGGK